MSRKAPKNYGKAVKPKQQKTTATPEEERQAKRIIGGIAIGLFVIAAILIGAYAYFSN